MSEDSPDVVAAINQLTVVVCYLCFLLISAYVHSLMVFHWSEESPFQWVGAFTLSLVLLAVIYISCHDSLSGRFSGVNLKR